MRLLKERLNDEATRDLYVNEAQVETVAPIGDGLSNVRLRGGSLYTVVGEAADVADTLKSASEQAIATITGELVPMLAAIAPTMASAVRGDAPVA